MMKKAKNVILLVLALVFALQSVGMPVAKAETINKLTVDYIFDGLGDALNYGVVAEEYTQNHHAETSVFVDKLIKKTNEPFFNTEKTYLHGQSYALYATVSAPTDETLQGMQFALFTANGDTLTMCEDSVYTVTEDTNVTSVSWQLEQDSPYMKKDLYIRQVEEDADGNYTIVDAGSKNRADLTVSYGPAVSSAAPQSSYIGAVESDLNVDSMAFYNDWPHAPSVEFGPDVKMYIYTRDWGSGWTWHEVTNLDYPYYSPNGAGTQVYIEFINSAGEKVRTKYDEVLYEYDYWAQKGAFYVDYNGKIYLDITSTTETGKAAALIADALKFSKELGNIGEGGQVKYDSSMAPSLKETEPSLLGNSTVTGPEDSNGNVVSLYTVDLINGDFNNQALKQSIGQEQVLIAPNEYIVFNVVCDSKDGTVTMHGGNAEPMYIVAANKDEQALWDEKDSGASDRVLFNFVYLNEATGEYEPFEGTIIPRNSHGGTLLAPAADITVVRNVHNGAAISKTFLNQGQETHQRTMRKSAQTSWVNMLGDEVATTGAVKLVKVKGTTLEKLGGVEFGLYSDFDCTTQVAKKTTTKDGQILFEDLEPGTYYIKELKAPPGYTVDEKVYTVEVKAGVTTLVGTKGYIENSKGRGTLMLTKVEEGNTNVKLEGALFAIYSQKGPEFDESKATLIGTYATNSSGKLTLRLEEGEYWIKEIEAPFGYFNDFATPVKVKVGAGETVVVESDEGSGVVTNEKKPVGMLKVTKVDAEDESKKLLNAKFTIYSDSTCKNSVGTMSTGNDGVGTIELPVGNYWVLETEAPQGYEIDSTEAIPVEITEGGTTLLANRGEVMTNTREKGSIWARKITADKNRWGDWDTNTVKVLPGAEFTVYDSQGKEVAKAVTNSEGIVRFSLVPGSYTLKETKAPLGYEITDNQAKSFYVDANVDKLVEGNFFVWDGDRTYHGSFVNTKKTNTGAIMIFKVDKDDISKSLAGAEFQVYKEYTDGVCKNPVSAVTFVTESDRGRLKIEGLDPGTYYVQEVKAPEGYQLPDPNPVYTATVVAGQDTRIYSEGYSDSRVIVNEKKGEMSVKAAITARKTLNDKEPAAGETFTFKLYEAGSDTALQTKQNEGGTITFDEIEYTEAKVYEYVIKEVAGDDPNITYDTTPRTVYVNVTEENGALAAKVTYGDMTTETPCTFVNTKEIVEVKVNKTWIHDGNPYTNNWPASLDVKLVINGETQYTYVQELNEGNGWSHTWPGLPKYDDKGELINYTVEENCPDGYAPKTGKPTASVSGQVTTYTIELTNTYIKNEELQLNFTAKKVLTGGTTDEKFTFKLEARNSAPPAPMPEGALKTDKGTDYVTKSTIGSAEGEKVTFGPITISSQKLMQYSEDFPHKVTYGWEVSEVIPNPANASITYDKGSYIILADFAIDENGKIVMSEPIWDENHENITGYKTTMSITHYDEEGNFTEIPYNDGAFVLTFTNTMASKDVSVTKKWPGSEKTDLSDKLTLHTIRDGVVSDALTGYAPTKDGNTYKWTGLLKYEWVNGEKAEITYVVKEAEMVGYEPVYPEGKDYVVEGGKFENKALTTSFSITKKWVGDDAANRPEPVLTLYKQLQKDDGTLVGDPVAVTDVTVPAPDKTNADEWTYTWEDLPAYEVYEEPIEDGSEKHKCTIIYSVQEKQLSGYAEPVYSGNTIINAAEIYAEINASKNLNGAPATETFTFELTDADGNVLTANNDASGNVTFPQVGPFTKADTYTYTMSEKDEGKLGYKYDQNSYTVEIVVSRDVATGELTADVVYANNTPPVFENKYEADSCGLTFDLSKELVNKEYLPEGESHTFKFEMKAADGCPDTHEITDAEQEVEFTSTSDAEQKIAKAFAVTFDAVGEYTFVVSETDGCCDAIESDLTKVYTVVVNVKDEGGQLVAETTSIAYDGEPAEEVAFVNTLKLVDISVTKVWDAEPTDAEIADLTDNLVLYADGFAATDENGKNILPARNGNVYTWSNLPKYANGVEITYTVKEDTLPEGYKVSYENNLSHAVDGGTITNTKAETEVVVKVEKFLGLMGMDKLAKEDALTFTFKITPADPAQEGFEIVEPELKLEMYGDSSSIKKSGDLKIKFTKDGTFAFNVEEVVPEDIPDGLFYGASIEPVSFTITKNEDGSLIVTGAENELVSFINWYGEQELKFTKKWNDANSSVTRPENIEIALKYCTVVLDEAAGKHIYGEWKDFEGYNDEKYPTTVTKTGNEWEIYIKGLPQYIDGANVKFAAVESTVPEGYTASYENSQIDFETETGVAVWAGTITNTAAVSASIELGKSLDGKDLEDGMFSFELLSEDKSEVLATVTNKNGKVTFSKVGSYTAEGEHTYYVREVLPRDGEGNALTEANGITYDATVYEVKVTVSTDAEGQLTTTVDFGGQTPEFKNKYEVKGTGLELSFSKELENAELLPEGEEHTFGFTLESEAGVKLSKSVSFTKANAEKQTAKFELNYEAKGEYKYTLYESELCCGAVEGSEAKYEIVVEVTDDGNGNLSAAVKSMSKDGAAVEEMAFVNTYHVTEITVTKVWEGSEGYELTEENLHLYKATAEGKAAVTGKFTAANGLYTWSELPRYDAQGEEIVYFVEEDRQANHAEPKYDNSANADAEKAEAIDKAYDGGKIINTYEASGEVALAVKKILSGRAFQAGDSFEFTLTAKDGAPMPENGTTVTLGWDETANAMVESGTFGAIKYDLADKDKIYTYVITESEGSLKDVTYDTTGHEVTVKITDNGDGTLTATANYGGNKTAVEITNTYEIETTEISVKKVWVGDEEAADARPESVKVYLTINGVEQEPAAELSDSNSWNYKWSELPVEDIDGTAITYGVKEEPVDDYTTSVEKDATTGEYVITNTKKAEEKTSITVTKVWEGVAEEAELPEITVQLLANGDAVEGKSQKLNKETGWTYTWTELPVKVDGEDITYTVAEEEVDGYDTAITGDAEEGFTITNTKKAEEEKTSIKVTKVWDDNNDAAQARPEKIVVKLLVGAGNLYEEVTLDETNNWTHTWEGLPAKNSQDKAYSYTVEEVTVDEDGQPLDWALLYTAKVTGSMVEGFTITNTLAKGDFEMEFTKSLVGGAELPEGETRTFTFKLYEFDNDVKGAEAGSTTITLPYNGSVEDVLGSITFDIKYGEHYYLLEEVPGEDADITYDSQKYKLMYYALVDRMPNGEQTGELVMEDYAWEYYPAKEDGAKPEKLHFTNTYEAPEKTSITVTKVWEDNNDAAGVRPEFIQVVLSMGGGRPPVGGIKVLNADNNWTYTWEDLNVYDGSGNRLEYTVIEKIPGDAAEYYVGTTTAAENGFILTNTYVTEEKLGLLKLCKSDRLNPNKKLEGAQYTLFTQETCKEEEILVLPDGTKAIITTGADGWGTLTGVPSGTYWVKETKAPVGYEVDPEPYKVEVKAEAEEPVQVQVSDFPLRGALSLSKTVVADSETDESFLFDIELSRTDSDPIAGSYEATLNGVATDKVTFVAEGKTAKATVSLKDGETLVIHGLRAGTTYLVSEQPNERYDVQINGVAATSAVGTISDTALSVAKFQNTLKLVGFTVKKEWTGLAEGETTPAIKLTLYCNGKAYPAVTPAPDKNGWYTYTGLPAYVDGKLAVYTVKEEPVTGFTTTYLNKGENAAVTDCAHNGSTIVNSKIPQTGDTTPLALWMLTSLLAAFGLLGVTVKLRKREN